MEKRIFFILAVALLCVSINSQVTVKSTIRRDLEKDLEAFLNENDVTNLDFNKTNAIEDEDVNDSNPESKNQSLYVVYYYYPYYLIGVAVASIIVIIVRVIIFCSRRNEQAIVYTSIPLTQSAVVVAVPADIHSQPNNSKIIINIKITFRLYQILQTLIIMELPFRATIFPILTLTSKTTTIRIRETVMLL